MRKRFGWFSLVASLLACLLVSATPLFAQEFRGSLTGVVKDATGGVLPGVSVTVTNTDTKVAQDTVTDEKGVFRALLLNPGTYSVTVKLDGFKTVVKSGLEVRVAEPTVADVTLETGGVSETVQVVAERPLLTTGTGISATTVDAKQIAQLPLGDGTAYMLTRLAPGIMDNSDLHFARPMDNGNLGGIVANGAQGGNEFSIDGAPNLSNAKGVGFSPPSDAISQFKVQTNAFDAQSGHTAGAVVNLALKSGTNAFKMQNGYFNRDASRTATPLLTERAGGAKPTRTYNRWSSTLSGPVRENKTFFMLSYEHLRDVQPEPATYTVPTAKMRAGDFSEFTTSIYDPNTATSAGVRTAFAGNQIPTSRINPVAAAYAALYPLPNLPGTTANYFTNQLRPYDYNVILGRIDHNINGDNRLFLTSYYNKRREDRYNWAAGASNADANGVINGFSVTQGYDYRSNLGVTAGWTDTLNASTLLDVRASFTRFGEWRDPAQTFDPSKLGFSSTAVGLMQGAQYLPLMTFGSFSTTNSNSTIASLGSQRSDWGDGFDRPMKFISLAPTFTKIWKEHSVRVGYDLRYMNWQITNNGYPAGRFSFNGAYTRANNSAATNDRAQSWAQFLLGLPTSGTGAVATPGTTSSQFEIAALGNYTQINHGFFVQDDWTLTPKVTVNLGVRMEINGGMTAKDNQNLAGFDTTSASPIEAAALAAYAKAPITQVGVADFKVKGGLLFANGPINKTQTKILPRVAGSFQLNDKTVIRGGIGLFSFDYFFENINQAGFSQATPVIVTNDNGITFTGANLSNPIPTGGLIQPVGNANGLASQLGQNLGTLYQPDRKTPYYVRWEVSVQRDLGNGIAAVLQYVSSRGRDLAVARAANNIPMAFLSTSRFRDTANESLLSANVANPFAGLLVGSTINGATVARSQLLRPYPQFGTFNIEEYNGKDKYDGATLQLEKRFKNGNSITMQYTYSKTTDQLNYLNPQDGILEDRISPNDRPHRFSLGTVYRLPFGHGEKFGADWSPVLDAILGGWQASGTFQYQTGAPLTFGNLYFDSSCGDPKSVLKSNIGAKSGSSIAGLDSAGWDLSCFYFHDAAVQTNGVDDPVKQRADSRIQLGNNVRYFPSTLPNVRNEAVKLLDIGISKKFRTPRNTELQVRIEAINFLNYTVLWSPDVNPRNSTFGYITTDRNNPRDIQIGLRFTF